MQLSVLGPVRIRRDQTWQPVPAAKQRALLALLLLHPGEVLDRFWIIDALWNGKPPPSAARLLPHYVWRLRALLPAGIADRLRSGGNGYTLAIDNEDSDHLRFGRLVASAHQAAARTDLDRAVATLTAALDLWRGPALADSRSCAQLETGAGQLDRLRLEAMEDLAGGYLAVGRSHEALSILERLTTADPYRERPWSMLLLALHRTGRRADALAAYQRLWRNWQEQLGVEPSHALRDLHRRLLADDSSLHAAADPSPQFARQSHPSSAPIRSIAWQMSLPPEVGGFVGRATDLERLDAVAADAQAGTVICTVSGTAGVGKTTLALHWAHRAAARFPDGQLYVNLRGFDPSATPMPPGDAIRRFLDAFGVAAQRLPAEPEAQAALYRRVLTGKRALIVLDNARDAEQVRPLLAGGQGCMILVTSRSPLSGLAVTKAARPIRLGLLSLAEARELLTTRLGAHRTAAEPEAVDEIAARCARLPLALAVAAAHAAGQPGFTLGTLACELRDTAGALDSLDGGDPDSDVRAVFSWSYRVLSEPARRLFRLIGLHPGPELTLPAAASLAGDAAGQVRRLLAELGRAHLTTEETPRRHGLHDLLRVYAAEQAAATDSPRTRRGAIRRMLDHYVHSAFHADRRLDPHRDPIVAGAAAPGVEPEHPAGDREAMAWFDAERPVLLGALRAAANGDFPWHAWQLAWTLSTFLHRRGYWHDWLSTQLTAIECAKRLADKGALAYAHRSAGGANTRLARFADAAHHLGEAARLYSELADLPGQGHTRLNLAWLNEEQGRHDAALEQARMALARYRAAGHPVGRARSLNAVGWCQARLGDHAAGLDHCLEALVGFEEVGDRCGQAATWDSLGYIYHHLGSHAQAELCYQRAIDLDLDLGDRFGEADTLTRMGETLHAAGELDAARTRWGQALDILHQLGHPHAARLQAKLELKR